MTEYNSLSLSELKKIYNQKKKKVRENYRKKIIHDIKKLDKINKKIKKGKIIKKKPKTKQKPKKTKSFEEYFQECIKNKKIPEDTPPYFRKALERAIKEHNQGLIKVKSALEDFAKKYIIRGETGITPLEFFKNKKTIIKNFLKNYRNIKVKFVLVCMMGKMEGGQKLTFEVQDKAYFHSDSHINIVSTNVKDLLVKIVQEIIEKVDIYQQNGSGWYLNEVIELEIHTAEYIPFNGSSYIPLPDWIVRKRAILNIQNKDNKCFLWCILRYLHPKEKNGSRIEDLRLYEDELNIPKGFVFPVNLKDINKFEKANPQLPGINVFSVDDNKCFYPLRMGLDDPQKSIDLFLYGEDGKFHYSLIKNFSRLFRSQITSRTNDTSHICKRCFSFFTKEELLQKHIYYCSREKSVFVKMPKKEDSILKFKHFEKQFFIPFVAYADFECFTKPISSYSLNKEEPYSFSYQKHEPSGFCFFIKGVAGKGIKPIIYTKKEEGEDIAKIFVEKIAEAVRIIYNDFYQRPRKLLLTKKEQKSFDEAKICHFCNKEIEKEKDKVRDHCHFTGEYRGAAHNGCNLKCRKPLVLPVIFHNLQSYDAHLFIKQLASLPGEFSCIPSTEEKYISFSKYIKVGEYRSRKKDKEGNFIVKSINFEIRFIDSLKFLNSSLEKLVKNLKEDDFYNIKQDFKHNIDLVIKKGVYPYDYVTDLSILSETQLPPKEAFYSKLNDEGISDDKYKHAINVWNTFNCKTIRDYHDFYLKTDVLLLADVFEKFRKTCMEHYQLDPAHFYTSPGLAWEACLKKTGQELQLLTDYDMLLFFERGIRGGMTHISKRYAEANNHYMTNFDPTKPETYIQYLDANNLYGWGMSQPLPTHGFKWMKNITKEKVIKILEQNDDSRGYIFDVDLEYPKHLWELHNDYPLAPEPTIVDGVEKLLSHFRPKKEYVVHYQSLKQYLNMGLKIVGVHRALSFKQFPWMKPYIDKNTKLRMETKSDFEKDFFKLMINSVFGKTIENIRKRQNVKIVDKRKTALNLSKKPNFERATIFDKNLIAIHMQRTKIYFNKPVYVGQAILDLSKTLMFDFHYNYIKPKYGSKAELLFTDTDSLMYHIQTNDFYKDITPDVEDKFDTSAYPPNHPSGIPVGINQKVIGMFKDEAAGSSITHFVGLRPKLYDYKTEGKDEVTKCKGIKKSVVKNTLKFDNYKQCLFSGEKEMRTMRTFQSENHDIYSKEVNKIALSCDDNKRIVLEDKIHTLALR